MDGYEPDPAHLPVFTNKVILEHSIALWLT